jgi:pyruvate/2-oxoglutarate dehydrogenase complex dihydrolipoamide dehydrogenase (E3) component
MIEKHGVRVKTNTPVDVAAVEAERPDVVVIATGSTPRKDAMNGFTLRTVAGWEQSNVIAGDNVVNGTAKVGESVVIYDVDAFVRAPAIAEMLADQGKRVRLITPAMTIGGRMEWTNVETITRRLAQRENLEILLQTVVLGIEGTVVSAFDAQRGRPVAFEDVDTLVVCGFGLANDGLYYELEGKVRELHLIGDALAPRTIDRALFDGHRVGRTI